MLLSISLASNIFKKQVPLIMPIAVRRSASVESMHNPVKRLKTDAIEAKPSPELELVEAEMALPIEIVKSYERELDYRDKLVLAPMVRTGSRTSISPGSHTEISPDTIAVPALWCWLGLVT